MYMFTLYDIEETVRVREEFKDMPSEGKVADLLLCVDVRAQRSRFKELMKADGEDVFFSTEDEDGFDEDEYDPIWDGVYATLEFVEDEN